MAQNSQAVHTLSKFVRLNNINMSSPIYIVGVHFSTENKAALEEKIRRLLYDYVKANNSKSKIACDISI